MSRVPIVFHEAYEVDIGAHVFPTAKYRLVRERLLAEGAIEESDLIRAPRATDAELRLVHTADYVRKLQTGDFTPAELLTLEVPYSPALRDAVWLCAGGSILTGRLALERGVAVHLGGGFHHAFPEHGEGFCPANDVAIAVQALQRGGETERAVVIDLDVHHGNGTAAIFSDDATVFTFSMHQERNYPGYKPPGDLDLGLADGTGDEEYVALLEEHLPAILEAHRPDLAFYLAGADPYHGDQLGGLGLTIEGLRRRDETVLSRLAKAWVPAAILLAGGYAWRGEDTVTIHSNTVRAAIEASPMPRLR
ncbi:MAG: histone deacetylase [Gemmatimonadota bacterium]